MYDYDVDSVYQWVYFSRSEDATIVIQILKPLIANLVFYYKGFKDRVLKYRSGVRLAGGVVFPAERRRKACVF